MDEKKPQIRAGLPDGVPPEAVKFIEPEQAWAARLVVLGLRDWLKSWSFRWSLLAFCVLVATVVVLSLTGNIYSYIQARQRTVLLTHFLPVMLALLCTLGLATGIARRHYRKHTDPIAAIRLMVKLTGVLVGGLMLAVAVAHYIFGFGLGTVMWLATPMCIFVVGVTMTSKDELGRGELCCAACRYSYDGAASEVCPECGSDWRGFASLTTSKSRRLLLSSSAKAILLLFVVIAFASVKNRPYYFMPTGGLVAGAPLHWHVHGNMFCEIIESRNLTPGQSRRLARRIAMAPPSDPMHFPMLEWYRSQILSGAVSREMANKFISRRAEIRLSQREVSSSGSDATVYAAMYLGSSFGGGMDCYMAVERLEVNGTVVPHAQCSDFRFVLRPDTLAHYEWRWPYELVGLDPGEHTVRAKYWIVMTDSWLREPTINWLPSGEPEAPPNTLALVRLEASTTISVPR